jgi:very-short-patch-repair endonuclease
VDFVVIDPVTTAILLVIELDDKTHRLPDRQSRDTFVDEALKSAGVAILRIPAAREYDLDALREQVEHALRYMVSA